MVGGGEAFVSKKLKSIKLQKAPLPALQYFMCLIFIYYQYFQSYFSQNSSSHE